MPFDIQDDLFTPAMTIMCREGLEGLSLRALAGDVGVSPSSLIYKFKSRDGLVFAVLDGVVAKAQAIWAGRTEDLPDVCLQKADFLALSQAVLVDQLVHHRCNVQVSWEFELKSALDPRMREQIWCVREAELSFWERCFQCAGLDLRLVPAWSGLIRMLERLLLVSDIALAQLVWAQRAILRLYERLFDKQIEHKGDCHWRLAAEQNQAGGFVVPKDVTGTPYKIIRAASEQILLDGCGSLSHRSIAARGKVSLSSMTHHFETLEEIMMTAFGSMYEDARLQAQAAPELERSYTKAAFIRDVLPKLSGRNQNGLAASVAQEDVILTASRRAHMRDVSIALFALMGATSSQIMQAIDDPSHPIDRFDAHVFRLVMAGMKVSEGGEIYALDNPAMAPFLEAFL